MSRLFETIVSAIKRPLFLMERQFTKPKFIGSGLRATSPNNRNRIIRHLTFTCAGNLFENFAGVITNWARNMKGTGRDQEVTLACNFKSIEETEA